MATTQSYPKELRGSQKLLANLARNGEVPSVEHIKKAFGFSEDFQMQIPNWLLRGTPADYLTLTGTLQVTPKNVSEVVNRLVALNDSTINLHIFTNGISNPELVNIVITNTPAEG